MVSPFYHQILNFLTMIDSGIPPGASFTYEIPTAGQWGSYWIHGHEKVPDTHYDRSPLLTYRM
jgi:FtsP/CotA-like multicopper oxidase with cupredoxin domain